MRNRHRLSALVLLGAALASAAPLAAQAAAASAKNPNQVQLDDLRGMKDKFVSLSEAFPADKYDWMPMEGVRSYKEVVVLLINEGYAFPTQWGAARPAGVLADRQAEMARLNAMDKAALVAELGKSFDNIIGFVSRMDDATRAKEIRFFGQSVTTGGAVMMATGDMHEHLGQLIAYARSNRVVPPWTAAAQRR
jgi:hypothetical protein